MSKLPIYHVMLQNGKYEYILITPGNYSKNSITLNKLRSKQILKENEWNSLSITLMSHWSHIGYISDSLVFRKKRTNTEEKNTSKSSVEMTLIHKDPTPEQTVFIENYQNRYAYLRCLCNMVHVNDHTSNNPNITNLMHTIALDWLASVCDKYKIPDESYSLACYIYYLFLSRSKNILSKEIQKYVMMSLYIACTVEEESDLLLMNEWIYMCDNVYTAEELLTAQKKILSVLGCFVMLPTIHRFIVTFIQEYNIKDPAKIALMYYLSNIACLNQVFPKYPSYIVAEVCFTMVIDDVKFIPQYYDMYCLCYSDLLETFNRVFTVKYNILLKNYNKYRKRIGQQELSKDEIKDMAQNSPSIVPNRILHYGELLHEVKLRELSPVEIMDYMVRYKTSDEVGEGTFGEVYTVVDDSITHAVKRYKYDGKYNCMSRNTIRELSIITQNLHKNIIKANAIYIPNEGSEIAVRMNLMKPFSKHLKYNVLSIKQVKNLFRQIMTAIYYLHKIDIIHRDIKPQNIIILDDTIQIIDLGASIWVKTDMLFKYYTDVCTIWYQSPESLLDMPYNKTFDIWSAGCILLEMIAGKPAFTGDNAPHQLFIIAEKFSIESVVTTNTHKPSLLKDHKYFKYNDISTILSNKSDEWDTNRMELDNAIDLIIHMLAIDPNYRYTVDKVLSHPFLMDG